MSSEFNPIREEFDQELGAIRSVVEALSNPRSSNPKARVASVNAATLLLAATFEEFVRECARTYARLVVQNSLSLEKLPSKIASTVWRRSMEKISRLPVESNTQKTQRDNIISEAATRFSTIQQFCQGDLTQDIYHDLIHNDNNMRPGEINSLFKVSGISNMCFIICDCVMLLQYFSEEEQGRAHGQLIQRIDDFFIRRNQVAHSISVMRSTGPDQIVKDIELLGIFGIALCEKLDEFCDAFHSREISTDHSATAPLES